MKRFTDKHKVNLSLRPELNDLLKDERNTIPSG